MHLGLVALVVAEYDPAISFFVDVLGFELVEDSPAVMNDGRGKRWVVVRPPGGRRPAGWASSPYGRVVVFRDIAGNKWDLIGPAN